MFQDTKRCRYVEGSYFRDSATVQLDGGTNGLSFNWSPEINFTNPTEAKPIVKVAKTTTFFLEKTSVCGKVTHDSLTIFIVPIPLTSILT
jgi:hypothetical protein